MKRGLERRGAAVGGLCAVVALAVLAIVLAADAHGAIVVATALAAVAACIAIGALVLREPALAVERVSQAAERVADGRLGQTVAGGPGQTGELAAAFNTMTRRVEGLFGAVAADQARLEAVFDASADAMVAVSGDSSVRLLNRAAEALFATTRTVALGRPFIETARDYELDGIVRRAAAGGSVEPSVVTFGAKRLPLRAVALPIPNGGDWAVLLMLTDLTEVQRVDQVRRDFVANVSHELRTPLASILALVETMEGGGVDPGDESDEFLRRIHQQADRLTILVNELLDLSRIESGAVELHPEDVDLAEVVAEVLSLLAPRADARGIILEVPRPPGPIVEADRPSIQRAVSNLLDNALKFSPDGATVNVELRDEGELVAIAVRDHGPGIPLQEQPRVFERFYKGDASRAGDGSGLGLAMVKHIVRSHGGTVEVESKPGEGATFTVRLAHQFVGTRADPGRPRRVVGPAA